MNNHSGPSHQHRAECDCPALNGGECIWPGCESNLVEGPCTVAWALKSCNGVYHGFFESFHEAQEKISNYEKSLKMKIIELVEKPFS